MSAHAHHDHGRHKAGQQLEQTRVHAPGRRAESEAGRFTLVFLAATDDLARGKAEAAPLVELTYNWDEKEPYPGGRNFGPPPRSPLRSAGGR